MSAALVALYLVVGAVTGVLSGLFGVGGGFLVVPFLSFLGWSLPTAIGTSLLYVTAIGIGGALSHYRAGNLDVRFVLVFATTSIVGAPLGAYLSSVLPEPALGIGFALFMLYVATTMQRTPVVSGDQPPAIPPAVAPTLGLGLFVGMLSGLFGIGGGLLFVPAQVRLFGIPLKRAVGNSLAGILVTGAAGLFGHVSLGHVQWGPGVLLVAGGMIGLQGGTWLLKRLAVQDLKRYLLIFLYLMAASMVYRAVLPFLPPNVGPLGSPKG